MYSPLFDQVGPPQQFAVFEVDEEQEIADEMRVTLDEHSTNVLDPQDVGMLPAFPRRSRRKRRRQRVEGQRPSLRRVGPVDGASRERIFQELEGLLRQLREEAEASSRTGAEQISLMAQTVSTFTRALEEQPEPISERAHSEYQRIREKLVQTLRGERPATAV